MDLDTTLLRERFVIRDLVNPDEADVTDPETVVAMSNRLVIPLVSHKGGHTETLVIRARGMHSTIRMAAYLVRTFMKTGPIAARENHRSLFQEIWPHCYSACDPEPWICVYHQGKSIFESGVHHPFLDVIEKCDLKAPGNYDGALQVAEDSFKKMGRHVTISHNSNIGMVVNIKSHSGRCGMILRNPHKSTTFNYIADRKDGGEDVQPYLCLNTCAAFLEGIQLSVRLGMGAEKRRRGLIKEDDPEAREIDIAQRRINMLSREIVQFENRYDVRYRLERPDFNRLIREAEVFQRTLIESSHHMEGL